MKKGTTWKDYLKKVQHGNGAVREKCNMKKMLHEKK